MTALLKINDESVCDYESETENATVNGIGIAI